MGFNNNKPKKSLRIKIFIDWQWRSKNLKLSLELQNISEIKGNYSKNSKETKEDFDILNQNSSEIKEIGNLSLKKKKMEIN